MENKYKIGVLFCGGCNCYFDREELYGELKKSFASQCDFCYYSSEGEDSFNLILLINGCQSECLMADSYNAPLIVINNKNCKYARKIITELLKNEFTGNQK